MLRIVVSALTILVTVAFSAASSSDTSCPEPLVVLPDASDVTCVPYAGTQQVSYAVRTAYPASEVIALLRHEIQSLGWIALAEDVLNPGQPNAHIRGWTRFGNMTVQPPSTVHQWMADWITLEGRVLRFRLSYEYPEAGPEDLDVLRVDGILIPAPLAKTMRADATDLVEPEMPPN